MSSNPEGDANGDPVCIHGIGVAPCVLDCGGRGEPGAWTHCACVCLQGVCKLPSGYIVLCERALPGERLMARVTAVKKSFATAHKLDVLRQHSNAVEAPCVHFQEGCGGCTMQNLAYASQLRAKEQQVCSAFTSVPSRAMIWCAST